MTKPVRRLQIMQWYWANPVRTFAWIVVTPVGLLAVALLNLLVGGTVVGVLFAVVALITAIQAVHYGPPVLRAAKLSQRAQNDKRLPPKSRDSA